MLLQPGERLGPYEILSPLGSGGMGEVYRARDTRLHRDVAVKVLPAAATADPDRQMRFEQEARAAAALNHPNIIAVFDVGVRDAGPGAGSPAAAADGAVPYIVTELLEGTTLADRLREGPMPARTAIDFGTQVARGLAAAHDRNIVHRDLKPANVFITTDGRAKILDFGLAKLTQPLTSLPADSVVPTTPMGTTPGMAFGTVGYMAPEQVRGQAVDHRADIFALGVLLYEMVTGRRAFARDTPPETLTAILREDVAESPLSARQTPPPLSRIIRRCVEKNPSGRFQSALDLAFALEALDAGAGSGSTMAMPVAGRGVGRFAGWAIAVLAIAGAVTFAIMTKPEATAAAPVMRFQLVAPSGDGAGPAAFTVPSISPDGRRLAFAGGGRVWIHSLDELTPRPVGRGAQGQALIWSPDGGTLAHNAGASLRLIDPTGGSERTICELPTPFMRGGAWNNDGVIVVGSAGGGLMRCSANGGPVTRLTELNAERQETGHLGPTFLPDGRQLLYWAQPAGTVWLTSLDGGAPIELLTADSAARYAEPGYLLFVRKGTLLAQSFDVRTRTLGPDAIPVVDQVLSDSSVLLGAAFDVSRAGVLVYRSGFAREASQLTWVDRGGKPLGTLGQRGFYSNPNLSRDGAHLAVERLDNQTQTADIWTMDLERSNVLARFTSDPANELRPVWSPDGEWIAFASDRSGIENVYRKRANNTAAEELVLKTEAILPSAWAPDGASLLYQRLGPIALGILTLTDTPAARLLDPSRTQSLDRWGELSPDGKWLAFSAQEGAPYQVYVQSFPSPDRGKWLVSGEAFGMHPRWGPDGSELFYLATDGWLMSATVSGLTTLTIGAPQQLFQPQMIGASFAALGREQQYAVAPDGKRFLINAPVGQPSMSPLTVILNWQSLLNR